MARDSCIVSSTIPNQVSPSSEPTSKSSLGKPSVEGHIPFVVYRALSLSVSSNELDRYRLSAYQLWDQLWLWYIFTQPSQLHEVVKVKCEPQKRGSN